MRTSGLHESADEPCRQRVENRIAFRAGDNIHGDVSLPLGPAVAVSADRAGVDVGIERQQEHLTLVDPRVPSVGTCQGLVDDARPPGVKGVLARAANRFSGQRPDPAAQREAATFRTGDVVGEVVDPVAFVDPAAVAGHIARHRERVRRVGVAERDHWLGKADRDLACILRVAARREGLDSRLRAGTPRTQREDREDALWRVVCHHIRRDESPAGSRQDWRTGAGSKARARVDRRSGRRKMPGEHEDWSRSESRWTR